MKMVSVLAVFIIMNILLSKNAYSAGVVFTNKNVQVAQTSSKALIIYDSDNSEETIYDSFEFNTNPIIAWNFAWLIAVPEKPEIEYIPDETFTKLEDLTKKNISKNNILDKLKYFNVVEEKNIPSEVFTRGIDLDRFEVISPPDQYSKIESWTSDMGYLIPKEANNLINEYQKNDWYFVIADVNANHIQIDATDSLNTPGAHTLPIKISFKTDKIIYPLKLVKIQSDYDSKDITLNYNYGLTSEDVLGVKDERVDSILSEKSKNDYPRIPLDYMNYKTELFVIADKKAMAEDFYPIYASKINRQQIDFEDYGKNKYIQLPKDDMYITRLISFKPKLQLEDLYINYDSNQRYVNSKDGNLIYFVTACIVLFSFILYLKIRSSTRSRE